jgi:hypothetical protein
MTTNRSRGQRAAFFDLPLCTRRAIETSLEQQLEERTLQAAKRRLVPMNRAMSRYELR